MNSYSGDLLTSIAHTLSKAAERPALWTDGRTYSYRELESYAAAIRHRLVHTMPNEHTRIGIVTGDDARTYAALLAIWSVGAAYVPLNSHSPPERNKRVIEQANLDLVLVSKRTDKWGGCLPDDAEGIEYVDISDVQPGEDRLRFPNRGDQDLAYIFFTSGSTGVPKGVPITHGNLNAFMHSLHNQLGYQLSGDDRFLQMFEMTFDLSVMSIFAPWSCGACCYVVPDSGIAYLNILEILSSKEITVALMVPSVLSYMSRFFEEVSFPELRLSLFCGEALAQDMVAAWSVCVPNARIENVYGPTEATIFCTTYEWNSDLSSKEVVNGIVPIGQAMTTCDAVVLDSDSNICALDERGELALLGPQVMSGYWSNPKKTAEAMVDIVIDGHRKRAYRTGDIAFVNEHGNLIYCGRLDSQVKIDGHRVELGEIEHHVRNFLDTSKVAVILKESELLGVELRLFVPSSGADIDALRAHLKANLPGYMQPREIIVLDDLPLNLNGKIDRPALARMDS